ncbi:MAG: carboxypeptidase regulatory-like domain-containing protein [Chlorobium sp.]|nr:carboxypeptidase regulatory-like domain-containing protein [Chlorobium sp.]
MRVNAVLLALGIVVFCIPRLRAADMPTDSSTTQAAPYSEQPLIVELFFNDSSSGIQRCYETGDDIWIPFDLFHQHASLPEIADSVPKTTIKTTLGPVEFSPESLKMFEGVHYVSLLTLKESFHVHPLFNDYLYAIKIVIPWTPLAGLKKTDKPAAIVPDIAAPKSSLSFLHLESDLSHRLGHETNSYLELEAGGRIGGGTWDVMGKGDPSETLSLSRYHWTNFSRHTALRIGTGSSESYTLLNNLEYTGLQFAWNNRGIMRNLENTQYSDADVLLNIGSTQRRTIEGAGPPAGIAELRFDGHVAARQRIPFNGRFIFRNVRMTADLRITEVYLYKHTLLEKPARIIDYSQSLANRSFEKQELLVHGAVGSAGNVLEDDDFSNSFTGFGHILYGLNRRLTLESALQHNPRTGSMDFLFGPVLSIGSGWNAALYGAQANGRTGGDVSLFGQGKAWRFTERSLWYEQGFGYDTREALERHQFRLQTKPFSWLSTVLYGNYTKEGDSIQSQYILPGGTLRLSRLASISVMPDDEGGDYLYEAYLSPRHDTDIRLQYDNDIVTANVDYDFGNGDNMLQLIHSYTPRDNAHASGVYLNLSPGESGKNRIQLGGSYSQSGLGFTGSWSRTINAGLHYILAYRHNIYHENAFSIDESAFLPEDNAEQTISFNLVWDLGRSNSRFYPINRAAINHTKGGMAGALKIMTDSGIKQSSINDVAILINGRKLGQQQKNGSFFIGNLRPGIYSVSVDTEKLPVELAVERQKTKVEVRSGSVTEVIIPVYAEYGAVGKVSSASGNALAERMVGISDSEGTIVKKTLTDRFGYYRVDGLRKGSYTATVLDTGTDMPDHMSETGFTITNAFLFDIDLVVP